MCVCLTINARKKFRIKIYIPYRTKPTITRPCFCCNVGADIFVGITIYRSHKKVVSAGPWKHPKPPHNVLAPESTLTRVNSSRVNSHSPMCQLVPCVNSSPSTRLRVNSSPGQLEPRSTRTRVNSSPSQLVPVSTRPGSTRPRVNSSPCHTSSPSQLVLESTRPRVNSSSSQLVPGSARPRVNSR